MNRYEINAMLTSNDAMKYRFVDFASSQSFEVGQTEKDAIEKTFTFINKQYYPYIRGAGRRGYLSNGKLAGALTHIKSLGKQVYKDFVPESLRKTVHDLEDGSILTFISDNLGIPWELVYNDVDFWGKRFIIHKIDSSYRLPLRPIPLAYNKVLNIVGASLDDEAKEATLSLFDGISNVFGDYVNIDGSHIDSIQDVFQEIADADLINITCHGDIDQEGGLYLQIVDSSELFMNLTPGVIDVLPIKPGCLVFANACVSSGVQPGISRSMRFGPMFCSNDKKGGVFIGTLDLIPDIPAIEFARCFYYEYLFRGFPVGESLRLAKCSQICEGEVRFGMFPLVYSLYGNPYVQGDPLYE
jgi:hypothetical protein